MADPRQQVVMDEEVAYCPKDWYAELKAELQEMRQQIKLE